MNTFISLMLVGALALTAPVYAGGNSHGQGFHHGGSHHGHFHHGCCFSPAFFVSGVFVGAPLAPWYYPPYPYPYPYPVYMQPQEYIQAPERDVCYPGGCYHLNGDGVNVAYQWIWIPSAPSSPPPPPPPSSPPRQ
jgi:hypothetical protein